MLIWWRRRESNPRLVINRTGHIPRTRQPHLHLMREWCQSVPCNALVSEPVHGNEKKIIGSVNPPPPIALPKDKGWVVGCRCNRDHSDQDVALYSGGW